MRHDRILQDRVIGADLDDELVKDLASMKIDMRKRKVKTQIEDTEHKFEGINATLGLASSRTEIWDVHNVISDVHHPSLVNFDTLPSEWKTLCGWYFVGKSHARTNSEEQQVPSSHRSCPRCYPNAKSAM